MLNKTILMGRLTAEPKISQTPNGINIATFSLAVHRQYDKDKTDFINIVAWRQTADFVSKYFKKGQLVAIEGNLQSRSYEDKQGNKRYAVEVVAEQVYFTGSNKNNTDKLEQLTPPPAPKEDTNTHRVNDINVDEYESIEDEELPWN